MKLPIIPIDKANHFIYGFVIFILTNVFILNYYAIIVVFIFAITKEIYDQYIYSGFDWKDMFVTILPAITLTVCENIK